jgi:hypothetical protein
MSLSIINGLLAGLNVSELRQLNSEVVSHINHQVSLIQRKAMLNLRVGSLAEFTNSRTGRTVRVRIEKMNSKTVSAREINIPDGTDKMETWRVSPSMLRPV